MKKTLLILVIPTALLLLGMTAVFLFVYRDIDPPNTSDLTPQRATVAEADNAATHFDAAVAAIDWPEDEPKWLNEVREGKASHPEHVAHLLAQNAKMFQFIDRGLECRVCQGSALQSVDRSHDELHGWRILAGMLSLKAAHDREAGRWTEATTSCCKMLRLGDLAEQGAESTLGYSIATSMLREGLDASRQLALSPEAPADELRRLAEALAAVPSLDRRLAGALKAEYQFSAESLEGMAEEEIGPGHNGVRRLLSTRGGYLFQPNKTRLLFAELYRDAIESASLPAARRDFSDCLRQIALQPNGEDLQPGPNRVGRMSVLLLLPSMNTTLETKCRTEGVLAATRLVVACRRYEIDHGELPPALEALVPTYLDAVPRDPYDEKPLRYVRDRAIVYSIGQDLVDSGGSEKLPPESTPDDENQDRWEAEDAVFPIHGPPAHTSPNR